MIFRQHVPEEPLARYVDWFWFFEDMYPPHRREHVLPDGTFELVIDLREEPRRMFDRGGSNGETLFREAWMSGAHSQYIVIDALPGSSMIGVHFKPGGAAAILGFPADELRDQVVALDAIWGGTAAELRDRLLQARGARAKFAILERSLSDRLTGRNLDEAQQRRVFWARDQLLTTDPVRISDVVNQVGISHKHFIEQFRRHVGLTPKLFCRIRRFQRVLAQIAAHRQVEWAELACACGYFDQAHFVHDFRAFSGLNPTDYLRNEAIEYANFIPVEERG